MPKAGVDIEVVNQNSEGVHLGYIDYTALFVSVQHPLIPRTAAFLGLHILLIMEMELFVTRLFGRISCGPLVVESSHGGCKANKKISKVPLRLYLSSYGSSSYIMCAGCASSVSDRWNMM